MGKDVARIGLDGDFFQFANLRSRAVEHCDTSPWATFPR
jgi:hypothetical protein